MVFAIRRLLLRTRIPNPSLQYRSQLHLRHTPPTALLRTQSCLQHRAFSAQPRYNDDEKPSKKGELVPSGKSIPKNREERQEFDEIGLEDEMEITPEKEALIKKWQTDIGISDERLAYLIDTYPGIDAPLITAVHQGKIPEDQVFMLLEQNLEEDMKDLTPEQQRDLVKLDKDMTGIAKDMFDEDPNFSSEELEQLGLKKSDIAALKSENGDLSQAQINRITKAMAKLGLSEQEMKAVTDEEEIAAHNKKTMEEMGMPEMPDEDNGKMVDVDEQVLADIKTLQQQRGISDERINHFLRTFNGITADLIQGVETNKFTEERLAHYVEKYGGERSPLPLDTALIVAMENGELEEAAFGHVVENIPGGTPDLIMAVLKGGLTIDEVMEMAEKYQVGSDIIMAVHRGELPEKALEDFESNYPGVVADLQLLQAIQNGELDAEKLKSLKNFGEKYPSIMSAAVFRKVLVGEVTEQQLEQAEEVLKNDPWNIPSEALREWQQEYGVSDQMLHFLKETYPGIWPDLVVAFAKGDVKEKDLKDIISGEGEGAWKMGDEQLAKWKKEWDISEERFATLREKYPDMWPDLMVSVVQGKVKEEDVAKIIEEDLLAEAEESDPWDVPPEILKKWQQENEISDDMLAYCRETYPGIWPDLVADFASGDVQQKDIPRAILDSVKEKLTKKAKREEKLAKGDQKPLSDANVDVAKQGPQGSMKERITWYEQRYPGIDMETIMMAEMGLVEEAMIPDVIRNIPSMGSDQGAMRTAMEGEDPVALRKAGAGMKEMMEGIPDETDDVQTQPPNPMDIEGPLTKALPSRNKGKAVLNPNSLSVDQFGQMMMEEGIDIDNLSEAEVFKLMDEKFAPKDWEHTDEEGDTMRFINAESPEHLKEIQGRLGSGLDPIVFNPGQGNRDWASELAGPDSAMEEREIEQGLDQMFGALSKEEIADEKKDMDRPDEGFFNYGEENSRDVGEDEEFQGDDLSAQGHSELEQHRELREYARLAAWELPLLHKLAKPFETPKDSEVLRFRYTTYFGEQHPADKKVVVEFAPNDLRELTDIQRMKLIKLAGVRYNPSTGLVKMSSESFETQAQNKRYLGDLIAKIIKESKDPKDTFEDVPADFRHHKPKPFHKLPERWKLTPERRKVLEEKRTKVLEAEREKKASGQLVDGVGAIEQAMKRLGMAQLQERNRLAAAAGTTAPVAAGSRAAIRGKVGQPRR